MPGDCGNPSRRSLKRFSRICAGQHQLIDHIMISHALPGESISVDADVSGLTSIGTNPNIRHNAAACDHAP